MRLLFSFFLISSALLPAATVAQFDTGNPENGPFPSDAFAIPDPSQKTGERVDLHSGTPFESLLDQLDGFSVNPRINVCFSGPIDPATAQGNILIYPAGGGPAIGLNQLIYEAPPPGSPTPTSCVYGKPQQPLAQTTKYLLVVTSGTNGNFSPSDDFTDCINGRAAGYCASVAAARDTVSPPGNVVSASLFTTMSATAWLESAKKFVDASEPPIVLPAGLPFEFSLSNLSGITWLPNDGVHAPTAQPIDLTVLKAVDKVAFGLYLSPNFLNTSGSTAGTITTQPTNSRVSAPVPAPTIIPGISSGYLPISFHVFLPPHSAVHGNQIPVVIYGHGMGDSQFGAPTYIANTLASHGFATLAIEIPGHGLGPLSTVQVTTKQNLNFTMLTPGRGVSLAPGSPIGPTDGCIIPGPVAVRDCARQAAVDLMALVRTIKLTNGLELNLDPNHVYYVGQSFGSTYGAIFSAIEPEIQAAVINSGGGTSVDIARLAISGRPLAEAYLRPLGLLNVPPANSEAYFGPAVNPTDPSNSFNDFYVLRDQNTITNYVPGAIPIQNAFEWTDWLGMLGDPIGFAGTLKNSGNPVLVQFGYGDLEVPNPTESAFVRAAGLQSSTWFLHFERAVTAPPQQHLLQITMPGVPLPILPHRILSNPTIFTDPAETSISLALQKQVAGFFSSNGTSAPDPNGFLTDPYAGQSLFEHSPVLPEQLNFLQLPACTSGTFQDGTQCN